MLLSLKDYHLSTAMQDQGYYDIVDLPQDKGANETNGCGLRGNVVPKIITCETKHYPTVTRSPVTSGIFCAVMHK